ncbi:hypothetical protein CSAL01_05066 [Colletotrichum salicis]|uniref:Uncharacterized protein n=1 Tax=Colletotrichum salicis TaxID=1209931 RepID=A0A135U4U2_9PEZI|nr:hypothetical protein CSAL01_05066 [Colletotrichum salicis]
MVLTVAVQNSTGPRQWHFSPHFEAIQTHLNTAFPLAATFFNSHASPRSPSFQVLGADWSRQLETRRGIDFLLRLRYIVRTAAHITKRSFRKGSLVSVRASRRWWKGKSTAFGHALTPGRPIVAAPNSFQLAPEAEVVLPSVVHGINIWKRVLVQGAKARPRPDGNFKRLFRSRLSALDLALNVVGG